MLTDVEVFFHIASLFFKFKKENRFIWATVPNAQFSDSVSACTILLSSVTRYDRCTSRKVWQEYKDITTCIRHSPIFGCKGLHHVFASAKLWCTNQSTCLSLATLLTSNAWYHKSMGDCNPFLSARLIYCMNDKKRMINSPVYYLSYVLNIDPNDKCCCNNNTKWTFFPCGML